MQFLLAWQNLTYNKTRTVAAVAGVAFVITLIFVQLGMRNSIINAGLQVYNRLNFDLVLISPNYLYINKAGTLPRRRLYQAESLSGVAHAMPFYVALAEWRNPETSYRDFVQMLAFHPRDRVFRWLDVEAPLSALQTPDTVFIDRRARPEAGPKDTGVITELGGRKIRIAGQFTLGAGFTALGAIIVSDQTFSRVLNGLSLDRVSLGLVTLAPGAAINTVADDLRRALPPDVQVLTRTDLNETETRYWIESTSTGIVLHTGVFMAFIVGMVVLYQLLATDISNRLPEYATLKAIGYPNRYLSQVVFIQAFFLALMGYAPALVLSFGLYDTIRKIAHIPIEMTLIRIAFVLGLSISMCSVSGLAAVRKAKTAEPAELF